MVIRRTDRIQELVRRDESLIEVFAGLSPTLERLRNAETRKVMSGLLTVEQVAEMAGIDPDTLVARLNGEAAAEDAGGPPARIRTDAVSGQDAWPAALKAIPQEWLIEADVREDLRAGREPFNRIMAARREVPDGGALCVRATFEPIPLYFVMERAGFTHHTERLADDDWLVWFYSAAAARPEVAPETESVTTHEGVGSREGNGVTPVDDDIHVLDVRGLEPPEPMVRTLEVLESLPDGHTMVQLNVRVPQFLLPLLEERGFTYEIHEQSRDLVRVLIRRAE